MKLLAIVLVIGVVYLLLGCAAQRRILYPRHVTVPAENPGEGVEGLERWSIDTGGGAVEAWFMPGDGADAEHPAPAVIFAHGNAELIDHLPAEFAFYRAMGVSVLLVEYRGYGRSEGKPSQAGIVADYAGAYERLIERDDVDSGRIVFHGRSLGTGVVSQLAARHKPAALILQSPFTSVASMMGRYLIPRPFCLDPYDTDRVLGDLDRGVLILHGTHDTIIPISHGRKLDAIAPRSTMIEYDCGHNDFPVMSDEYRADVAKFLRQSEVLPEAHQRRSEPGA